MMRRRWEFFRELFGMGALNSYPTGNEHVPSQAGEDEFPFA